MTLFHGLGIVAYSGVSGAAPGMVLLTPTSIAYSGTSASVGANGQVTFTAVTSLSLNGCFTADFDNYVVSMRSVSGANPAIRLRMRLSGTDATASNYTWQYLIASGTSVTADRLATDHIRIGEAASTLRSGMQFIIYGPYLAQPTAARSVAITGYSSAYLIDQAGTHSLSTSYDGMTLYPASDTLTGALQVYGIRS